MLLELSLRNFAIIDSLSVAFTEGLNIITGETGTGKSVIVDAIGLVLGAKGSADYVRSSAEAAQIEALFSVAANDAVRDRLAAKGFPVEGDELVVRRTIPLKGRGRIYINGSLATGADLAEVTRGLVDVFGQHEHQSLLREDNHLRLLDEFAAIAPLLDDYGEAYSRWMETSRELNKLEDTRKSRLEREDLLRYEAEEIDRIAPQPGEDERLEEERKRLAHAQYLRDTVLRSYDALYESHGSVVDNLKKVYYELEGASRYDASIKEVLVPLEGVLHQLEDASFFLRDYAAGVVVDDGRLEEVENRLDALRRLKSKHSASIEEILKKRERIEGELGGIEVYERKIEELTARLDALSRKVEELADRLGDERRRAALRLEERVVKELALVGLDKARFVVSFDMGQLTTTGRDRVSFLFTANPDEDPKPLGRVASGGELSRVMLVLKESVAGVEGSSVLIFDEADAGIGGAVAETVGRKIKNLSASHQVIAITHLPQVAKFADNHIKIEKRFEDGRTVVSAVPLDRAARVEELARMLGGLSVTAKTLEAAREMLGG